MKLRPPFRLLGLAGLGAFIALPALAQDAGGYGYGGISVGRSQTDTQPAAQTAGLVPGATALSSSADERDTAYKLFGGYRFNRHIAVEAGYFNLGKNSFNAVTSPPGTLSGETKVHGLNLDLVGTLPLTERLSALARVGAQHAWSKTRVSGTGAGAAAAGSKHDGSGAKVGLGLQYEIHPSMWLRGEIERYRVKNAVGRRTNVDVATVSLVIPFGRTPAPRRVAAAVQAPVAPPEPPAAVSVAPPPAPAEPAPPVVVAPPVAQRVSFSANTLFDFDRSAVRPEGRTELDAFSQRLTGTSYDSISVEGHADRLGSDAYNQGLSTQRAASVKDYLVINGKIDPAKITATGKGESRPVTAAADCPDTLPRAKLIACLQPDRRAEIEVTGKR